MKDKPVEHQVFQLVSGKWRICAVCSRCNKFTHLPGLYYTAAEAQEKADELNGAIND